MKLRVRYSKMGKVRFVGNLDVTRIWERALRKAELPVAYSTGFSPRPRLSFGLALPLAAESTAEYVDIDVAAEVELDGLIDRLSSTLPTGFDVLAVAEKLQGQVSLQEDVVACDWLLELEQLGDHDLAGAVTSALAAPALTLTRERKGEQHTDDVRPSIEALSVDDAGRLVARLVTIGRGLRPTELVQAMCPHQVTVRRVWRTEQWMEHDGQRRELLPLPAAVSALVGAGA